MAAIQARPTTTVTGAIELVPDPRGDIRFGWTAVLNPGRWERRMGGYATEADAQRLLDHMLDEAEATARHEAEVNAFLDAVETRCDQCGSMLPASGYCTNCE